MNMEISPIHHGVVVGKQNLNLKVIMQRTKTTILFPDVRLILEKTFGFDEYDSVVLLSNDVCIIFLNDILILPTFS